MTPFPQSGSHVTELSQAHTPPRYSNLQPLAALKSKISPMKAEYSIMHLAQVSLCLTCIDTQRANLKKKKKNARKLPLVGRAGQED